MKESELKNMWQAYDKKIDKTVQINKEQLKAIQTAKVESTIKSFRKGHVIVMILGFIWIALLSFLVLNSLDKTYFAISVALLVVFNLFAVAAYLRHIIILSSVNIAESVTETQRKVALVRTSDNLTGRILLLQTPLYCTWWYTDELVKNGGLLFWSIQFIVVGLLTFAAIFLFVKLSPSNTSSKWLERTDRFFASEKLKKASELLTEIEEYKKEPPPM
jgi:hypothetical protein